MRIVLECVSCIKVGKDFESVLKQVEGGDATVRVKDGVSLIVGSRYNIVLRGQLGPDSDGREYILDIAEMSVDGHLKAIDETELYRAEHPDD